MRIGLLNLVVAIASAEDLVGIEDCLHSKRVARMAWAVGQALGYGPERLERLLQAGLVHDCGVSSTADHDHLIEELDWFGSRNHCERGALLLTAFPPLAGLAPIIRYHHSHWQDLEQRPLLRTVAEDANLIYLVDRVDMLAASYYASQTQLVHSEAICQRINSYRQRLFSPQLLDGFLKAATVPAFWLDLDAGPLNHWIFELLETQVVQEISEDDLLHFAEIIADIVDAKSPYTAEHSRGVARVAGWLAERAGLPPDRCRQVVIAGLVHDVGKLRIPDEILESSTGLSQEQRQTIKSHTYWTFEILRTIPGFDEMAQWAAFHHESLDGRGYPFGVQADGLALEARIMRVADVYQAMAQRRPYRAPTRCEDILHLLRRMEQQGEVDGRIVDLVAADLETCHGIATAGSPPRAGTGAPLRAHEVSGTSATPSPLS